MPRPICIGCNEEFRPKKNGVLVLAETQRHHSKYWHADLWECPECKTQIAFGFGAATIKDEREQGDLDFDGIVVADLTDMRFSK